MAGYSSAFIMVNKAAVKKTFSVSVVDYMQADVVAKAAAAAKKAAGNGTNGSNGSKSATALKALFVSTLLIIGYFF